MYLFSLSTRRGRSRTTMPPGPHAAMARTCSGWPVESDRGHWGGERGGQSQTMRGAASCARIDARISSAKLHKYAGKWVASGLLSTPLFTPLVQYTYL